MGFVSLTTNQLTNLASFAGDLAPLIKSLVGLASVVATLFIIVGGIHYITSSGDPTKLLKAKRIIRGAITGLVVVLAAGLLISFLNNAYQTTPPVSLNELPPLADVSDDSGRGGIAELLIKAIVGLISHIIETAAQPFIASLEYFTRSTPLMAGNQSVFSLWLVTVGIANSLLVLVVILLGFRMMSASSLGFEEATLGQLLPKLGAVFLLMNMSIFIIDILIGISNLMVSALNQIQPATSLWQSLGSLADTATVAGIASLIIMLVFLVLVVVLLVYYVMRLVGLYLGAVLSPIVALLQLLPGFRDFGMTATRLYLVNIFVLFVHGLIILLASSLFSSLLDSGQSAQNSVMAMVLAIATLISLLKTQSLMQQMSYVSVGPKAIRKLGNQFINGISATTNKVKSLKPKPAVAASSFRRLP